ncbi:helix-turn-helix transcriptional regulator [Alkalicaulis satelles]|uniref:Helix-turn-helix transcriptional regulator n=1 Tax=Alkalicaulis satelles TaxID=2609175 RepID=A0A5M6ZGU7_9PROT|nr:helix-turn-helix transcriptional regulator [Alkalicaulis satelles]KAA5803435.1 helix-turn-helix transcriptional regulator [Alkalicaulis satelles]
MTAAVSITTDALTAEAAGRLAALAHETRLTVFRALMRAGPDGLAAGALAQAAGVSASNLSAHLSVLLNAGLVSVRRDGRQRIYAPDFAHVRELLGFLVNECCQGAPEVCGGLIRC